MNEQLFFCWDYLIQMLDGSHHHTARERSRRWWGQVSIQAGYSSHPERLPAVGLNNVPTDTQRGKKLNKTQMPPSLKATSSENMSS